MMGHKFLKSVFLVGMITTVSVPMAFAGFQFTAPAQPSVMPSQPVPPVAGGLLPTPTERPSAPAPTPMRQPNLNQPAPIILDHTNNQPAMPKTGIQSIAPRTPQPQMMSARTPAPMTATPQNNNNQLSIAAGFGNDLPLVTALRQVIPSDYTYVLEESVPMGETVSWSGGRPWNQVLSDMIAPMGLNATIANNQVIIRKQAVPSAPMSVSAAPQQQSAPSAPMNIMPEQAQPATNPVANDVPWAPPVQPQAQSEAMQAQPQIMDAPLVFDTPAQTMPAQTMAVQGRSTVAQMDASTTPLPSRVIPEVTRGNWMAVKGDSLRSVLDEWTAQAGAELFWSSDFDYPLAGDVNVSGTFEEAAENLLSGFEQAKPKPVARLHPNMPHGPAVLVVETIQTLN